MQKRFDPSSQTTKTLFNSELFQIPRYQRSYSWKDTQLEDFVGDFLATKEDNSVFLGTVVLDKSSGGSVRVIDGQQRLLTLTITFAVIRDILKEEIDLEGAKDLARDIQKAFIESGIYFGKEKPPFRIQPSKDVEGIFERYIQQGGPSQREKTSPDKRYDSHKLIINAYTYIRRYITRHKLTSNLRPEDKLRVLAALIENLSSIEFIKIDVYDGDLAFSIFESHNAKGADLLVSDLVKNHLYDQLKMPEEEKEVFMKGWDDTVIQLKTYTGVKIDKFLHYHMQSYEGRFAKSQLFKIIKARIKEIQPAKFLKEIKRDAAIFSNLIAADIQSDNPAYSNINYSTAREINDSLEGLATFNVDQCYILLLSIFRNTEKISPKFLVKITNLVENFTFKYSKISQGQANVLEKVYAEYATKLNEKTSESAEVFGGKIHAELKKEFARLDLGYDVFSAKFVELDYSKPSQKKLIQYIFKKMESYKSKGATTLSLRANIDHIFPQNPPQGNKTPILVHKIGNLVPVDSVSNSSIGNALPEDKIELYESISNILLVKDLAETLKSGKFDTEAIKNRSEVLAQYAYSEVWDSDN
jgi:uncharacterized protein with ParB-like and HNH nuclease domain